MLKKPILGVIVTVAALALIMVARTLALPGTLSAATPITAPTIAGDGDAIAAHLGEAVRIETISWGGERAIDSDAFDAFATFLETTYPSAHSVLDREIVSNHSLVYRWPGANAEAKPIGLIAHIDVVPVEPGTEDQWTHPPFSGAHADGAVWGRGTLDNKGQLIAIMEAVERLAASGFTPERDICLLFGHDEELGGADGAAEIRMLLDRRNIHFDWTLDEGSGLVDGLIPGLSTPIALISIAEKGSTTLKISATAPGGHSSAPGDDTAVSLVARAVVAVMDDPYPLTIDANMTAFLHAIAPQMPFAQRLALANLWLTRPLVAKSLGKTRTTAASLRTTTAATMINGGIKVNILPQTAHAFVNYRIHPRDNVMAVRDRAIRQIADNRITVEAVGGVEPSPQASTQTPAYLAISEATRAIFGAVPVAPFLTLQGTDTRHYVGAADNNYRFTPFIYGDDDLKRIHGANERVLVADLIRAVAWYEELIKTTADENGE